MAVSQIVTENQLDAWVRANAAVAQGKVVELVWRLVCVSCPRPTRRRFPLPDSIGQHGPDGDLDTAIGYGPFVPEGKSLWEIGTSIDARSKANSDYDELTNVTPEEVRRQTTFVFVTPFSGRRGWKATRKKDGIESWVVEKQGRKEWKAVKVIDGTQLTDWVHQFPAEAHALAGLLGPFPDDFDTAESQWQLLKAHGAPPPLLPELFITSRQQACEKLRRLIVDRIDTQLRLDTRFPSHPKDLVSAYIASLPEDERLENQSRVLIFDSAEAFKKACALNESHVFVANFDLDPDSGHQLIQRALQRRHAVIYSSAPGGPPHGNSCEIFNPRVHEMKESLTKSGYPEERARTLTNHSGRDLNALLRLIQNLSAYPDWATHSQATDLAIAQLVGQWQGESRGDQEAVEDLSGNAYGEWITKIRSAASAKAAPLEFVNGRWKFTSRYEPWLYLGRLIGPEVLQKFGQLSIKVLSEIDVRLDLPKEQRHAASFLGRERRYSRQLRQGISETLAIMGAYGKSLSACPDGRPQQVARDVVRTLLAEADSQQWASLDDVLPMLSEADPEGFLNAVGGASEKPDGPFSGVFAEEGDWFSGGTFISGLLWALESLAWSDAYLLRVCCILANLASVDPGGQWSNRPANSLVAILLPWLPQTTAKPDTRHAAVRAILRDHPDVGWRLLLDLLPGRHSSSSYTHRPKWREFVPEDWTHGVTNGQQWEDEGFYADLGLQLAGNDPERLGQLLRFYFYIHPSFSNFAVDYRQRLQSGPVLSLTDDQRLGLWTTVTAKILDHRKYADHDGWRVPESALRELEEVAEKLKPSVPEALHKRLFSGRDFDLYEEKGNWEEQRNRLLQQRIEALREVLERGGFEGLKAFWRGVESPREVGNAYGADMERDGDSEVLPALLESEIEADLSFATAYIWRRFFLKGWEWVDSLSRRGWSVSAKVEFFATLPFVNEAWERAISDLKEEENLYWRRASAHPARDQLKKIEYAVGRLIDNGRADSAIQCFWIGELWEPEYSDLGLRALEEFSDANRIDTHSIVELFRHLQEIKSVDEERLAKMEVKFLSLLDQFNGGRPRTLHRHLAERPDFFCSVIRLLYRSKKEVVEGPSDSTNDEGGDSEVAGRAYRLLHDWIHPPGRLEDGSFDGARLVTWVSAVKAICVDSGHWESASYQIGEVLYYTPRDEGGLWPDSVCELLDLKEDSGFRRGLRIKIFNSRGVHGFSEGKEELELAEKWEGVATLAENKGFIRLGATLRELGKAYRHDAERSVLEDRHDFD